MPYITSNCVQAYAIMDGMCPFLHGSCGWDRTNDLVINSHSLLPLSYTG